MNAYHQLSDAGGDNSPSDDSSTCSILKELLKKHEYTLVKKLGKEISSVFLVKNPAQDYFAVKEICYRTNENFNLNAARQEINILKKLQHGYTVSYVESFNDDESKCLYIVMEYCTEGDLSERMSTQKKTGFFEEPQIIDWLVQMCLALKYLHQNNILHRDIKPQNVFLTEDGYLTIGDYGFSIKLERPDAYASSVVGADLYVSPEVYQQKYDYKCDIWSLGWLVHDLCMLNVWSDAIERRILHAISMRGTVPEISDRYSKELRELIRHMLSRDPEDRPSAEDILAKPFLKNAVIANSRIPEALERRFYRAVRAFDEAYNENFDDFKALLNEWKTTTDSLEDIHRKCTIGSLSGAGIGAAGGITAIVGAALAPVTFGASLIVSGVGIGVGVVGGATGAASNITNTRKQNTLCEKLKEIQEDYKTKSTPILQSLKTLRILMRRITNFQDFAIKSTADSFQRSWRLGRTTVAGTTEFIALGMLASFGRIAVQSANIGRAVAAASGVLSGILVIADLIFIVKDSREIHQMRQGEIDDPDKFTSPVLKGIAQMRKTHKELCVVLDQIEGTRQELNDIIERARAETDLDRN